MLLVFFTLFQGDEVMTTKRLNWYTFGGITILALAMLLTGCAKEEPKDYSASDAAWNMKIIRMQSELETRGEVTPGY